MTLWTHASAPVPLKAPLQCWAKKTLPRSQPTLEERRPHNRPTVNLVLHGLGSDRARLLFFSGSTALRLAACTSPRPPRPKFDCRRRRHGNTGAAGFDCRRRRHAGWPQGKREPRAIVRGAWWGRREEPRALGRLAQGDRLKEGDMGEGGEEADKGMQDVWQYSTRTRPSSNLPAQF